MTDTVTVSVEIPIDDLRKLQDVRSSRATWEAWARSENACFRFDAACTLAALDTPLPPEPIKVGDRVRGVASNLWGPVLAIHGGFAWVDFDEGSPSTVHVHHLTRSED